MQTLFVRPGFQLMVEKSFSSATTGIMVHFTTNREFVYADGKPVTNRAHFSHIPEPYKTMANEWFDQMFGKGKKVADVQVKSVAVEAEIEKPPSNPQTYSEEEYPK